jgi:phosphate transport system substrate-binding protein
MSETAVKLPDGTVAGMKQPRLLLSFILSVPVAVGLTACGGGSAPGGTGVIEIDGSSTVFPISEAVAEEFQAANPGLRVTVGESGSSAGYQKFCRAEIAITGASRPITPGEIDACAQAGIAFVELPIAYDGLTVVVHPTNTWATTMTVAELRRLWEPSAQGTITRWNQVRADWPDQEIHLFGAGTASGTFDYFTEAIVGESRASRGDYTASEDDNVLVQGVANDPAALGYFGLAYYEQNKDKLTAVAIDDEDPSNGAGGVLPSLETVKGGTYRPLSRPLFIYVSTSALERPEVQQLVDFCLTNGAGLAAEVGYVPLSDTEQALVRQRFATRTQGTMFQPGTSQTASLEELLKR